LAPEDYQAKFEREWEKVAGVAYRVTSMDELESVLPEVIVVLAETHVRGPFREPFPGGIAHCWTDCLTALNKFVTSWA
jgi:hypothetical protein